MNTFQNRSLSADQYRLLNMYIHQYNQTNTHIDQLLDMLDEIRGNILNIISFNQPRRVRLNNHSPNENNNINNFIRTMFEGRNSNGSISNGSIPATRRETQGRRYTSYRTPIIYDYNNPIDPEIYIDNNIRNNIDGLYLMFNSLTNRNNIDGISELFNSFDTNSLPTQQQIQQATRTITYRDIENPSSSRCPISWTDFNDNDQVTQIMHCGHIFLPNEISRWFSRNSCCPVCRYNIRNYAPGNTSNRHNDVEVNDVDSISDESDNEDTPNNQESNLHTIFSNALQQLLRPGENTRNATRRTLFDPSGNTIVYESYIRR